MAAQLKISFAILSFALFILTSCKNELSETKISGKSISIENKEDSIVISKKHHPNFILCDLDGDNLSDSVIIVLNIKNEKSGFKIIFGNKKIEYLGLGNNILDQDYDDLNWVGILQKVPKGIVCFNNVNNEGDIIGEEEVKESDKIKLPNDGIYIHALESCGGGVIYLKNEKIEWIVQD